jgi:hypothetical protein
MQIGVGLDNEGRHPAVKPTSKCLRDGTHGWPLLAAPRLTAERGDRRGRGLSFKRHNPIETFVASSGERLLSGYHCRKGAV